MKRFTRVVHENGLIEVIPIDFYDKLCLGQLRYTNLTTTHGRFELPEIPCNLDTPPDYIALYSQPCEYAKTKRTAVAFYQFDNIFDGKDGLYNAIRYNDAKRLELFKQRFSGVRCFISQDISLFGDVHIIENLHRIYRSRVVSLWLIHELGAAVIPHIPLLFSDYMKHAFDGLDNCSTVAFSTKGYVTGQIERELLTNTIRYAVDRLNLKLIVVYDTCGDGGETVRELFRYAIDRGVEVAIPNNSLKLRNQCADKHKETPDDR